LPPPTAFHGYLDRHGSQRLRSWRPPANRSDQDSESTALDPAVIAKLLGNPARAADDPLKSLTERERSVLELMAEGLSLPLTQAEGLPGQVSPPTWPAWMPGFRQPTTLSPADYYNR
jgi:hypothetical protein